MDIASLIGFVTTGTKIAKNKYDSYQLSKDIDFLHKRITDLYSDISSAHFEAAGEAILSMKNSKSPDLEARSAIGHMREAFAILNKVVDKTKTDRFLFIPYETDVIQDKVEFYKDLADMAAFIYITYCYLEELENAVRWKSKASDLFLKSLDLLYFSADDLEKINQNYVEYVAHEETRPIPADTLDTYTVEVKELEITQQGFEYIRNLKAEAHSKFLIEIDSKQLIA